jgi:hypothetical protein
MVISSPFLVVPASNSRSAVVRITVSGLIA